jgi:hypothetical protein
MHFRKIGQLELVNNVLPSRIGNAYNPGLFGG